MSNNYTNKNHKAYKGSKNLKDAKHNKEYTANKNAKSTASPNMNKKPAKVFSMKEFLKRQETDKTSGADTQGKKNVENKTKEKNIKKNSKPVKEQVETLSESEYMQAYKEYKENRADSEKQYIPRDPQILCSFVNTKLRDEYKSLDDLCKSLDINKNELIKKLKNIEYIYNAKTNKFE